MSRKLVKKQILEELFVELEAYPNYAVSNYGRVINVNTGRELRGVINPKTGHLKVTMSHNSVRSWPYVHRLVASAFFVDYEEGVAVEFINGVKTDCAVVNLTIKGTKCRR